MKDEERNASRRDLLRFASVAAAGLGLAQAQPQRRAGAGSVFDMKFEARDTVRIGFIGVGGRGNSLIDNFSAIPQVQVKALCDVVPDKVTRAQNKLVKAGKPSPAAYSKAIMHSRISSSATTSIWSSSQRLGSGMCRWPLPP